MEVRSLNKLFEIEVLEMSEWVRRPYQNNFFEIVYVERGSGKQCIGGVEYDYQEGNIFLLPPLNCHSFTIEQPSKFYFVKFLDHFFMDGASSIDYKQWFEQISHILANYNRVPGDIISSPSERNYIIMTIQALLAEYLSSDQYSKPIVSGMMMTMLNILARNIERKYIQQVSDVDTKFRSILRYINHHLQDPDELKIASLSERFHVSKTYFSEYFTKQAGVKLSEYIVKAKLKLAETYILHTDQSIKEIAYALGFTDSSHLSNSFKKHYKMTIRAFRDHASSYARTA